MQQTDQSHATPDTRTAPPLWLDLIVLAICMAISYFKPVPFPWKVPMIASLILAHLYFFHQGPKVIGLGKINWKSTLFWGFLIAIIVVVGISNLIYPIMERLLIKPIDTSAYGPLEGNLELVTDLWWKAMISAAIAEEIFYRGYVFFVLERMFGSGKMQRILIVLATAVYFGMSHSFQGIIGVLGITLTATVLGGAYYLSKKNLYAIILAHALIDTWSLFSLYKGGISLFFE